jgi:hypothetical protein
VPENEIDAFLEKYGPELKRAFDKHHEALAEILYEGDRHTAVVGGAIIDDAMEVFLKSKLRKDATTDALFKYPRPLATVNGKIEIAFAMGIIGPNHRDDLLCINDIRNFFAHRTLVPDAKHKLSKVTFDTQSPSDMTKNLIVSQEGQKAFGQMHAKMRFVYAVFALSTRLMSASLGGGDEENILS